MGQAVTLAPAIKLNCSSPVPVAVLLLGLRLRIPPGAWTSVYCERCVLSGRGLCDGPITRSEKSYTVWCVWVWLRNLIRRGLDQRRMSNHDNIYTYIYIFILITIIWMICFLLCVYFLFINQFIFRLARKFRTFSNVPFPQVLTFLYIV
jgi:hypothetical protein